MRTFSLTPQHSLKPAAVAHHTIAHFHRLYKITNFLRADTVVQIWPKKFFVTFFFPAHTSLWHLLNIFSAMFCIKLFLMPSTVPIKSAYQCLSRCFEFILGKKHIVWPLTTAPSRAKSRSSLVSLERSTSLLCSKFHVIIAETDHRFPAVSDPWLSTEISLYGVVTSMTSLDSVIDQSEIRTKTPATLSRTRPSHNALHLISVLLIICQQIWPAQSSSISAYIP